MSFLSGLVIWFGARFGFWLGMGGVYAGAVNRSILVGAVGSLLVPLSLYFSRIYRCRSRGKRIVSRVA